MKLLLSLLVVGLRESAADIQLCGNPEESSQICRINSCASAKGECTPCSQVSCEDGAYSIQFDDVDPWTMDFLTIYSSDGKDSSFDPEEATIKGSSDGGRTWDVVGTKSLSWTDRSSALITSFPNDNEYKTYQVELRKSDGSSIYIGQMLNPKDVPLENIALNGTASQSSTGEEGGAAERAIDGNTNGDFNGDSVTQTASDDETNTWWKVDFDGEAEIKNIVIYNRIDCCSERLTNAQIQILDGDEVVDTRTIGDSNGVLKLSFYFDDVVATGVKIQKDGVINLAEVEVFGTYIALDGTVTASLSSTREPEYLIPCTATLHEQDGSHTTGVQRLIVDDDTYVFGIFKNDFLKMVAVDRNGSFIVSRYTPTSNAFTVATWDAATPNGDAYTVSDLTFCEE